MANQLLERLSLPIVDTKGNPTQYFEDLWFELIQSSGGEDGNNTVDLENLLKSPVNSKINKLRRDLTSVEQGLKNSNQLRAKVNELRRDLTGVEQGLKNAGQLRARVNQSNRDVADLSQIVHSLLSRNARLQSTISNLQFTTAEIAIGETTFTTSGNQIITCNNSAAATVTLNTTPRDGERLIISRRNALVTVSGDVNGTTSINLISKFDTMNLERSRFAGEWMIS